MMDWDEFEKRGAERRERRLYPRRADRVTVIVGVLLMCAVAFWIAWGVKA
jgi:hypothetical protein